MTFVTGIFIIVANSLAVTNSVTLSIFFSSCSCNLSTSNSLAILCLFSRRCLEVLDLPNGESRANVSFICFWISSSDNSTFSSITGFDGFLNLSFLRFSLRLSSLFFVLPPCCLSLFLLLVLLLLLS